MLKAKVIKFEYTRNKPTIKYLLVCQRWDRRRDLVGCDITYLARKAADADRAEGHGETGPNMGWLVYNSLKAGNAHIEVLNRWNKSKALEDRDFQTMRRCHMQKAKRSVDVYDWTKNLIEPDFDEWYFMDKVEVSSVPQVETILDFKPKIGLEGGIWRSHMNEFVRVIKEYQFDE